MNENRKKKPWMLILFHWTGMAGDEVVEKPFPYEFADTESAERFGELLVRNPDCDVYGYRAV